ncbi:transcriptional regulator [Streptomyces sp. NPDC020490]|uniref:transcriptional regulator n=1 Tax=Streptomyces sp. NPDC020490 TaxID=3365078 RepID=UPI0037B81206
MRGETAAHMIRRLRLGEGWSQARLAAEACRAAGLPPDTLTRQDVYRWEKGKRTPREWLPFLAAALGVPAVELEQAAAMGAQGSAPVTVADFLPETDPLTPLKVRQGRRIGAGDVTDLAGRVHGLRLADDVLAGGDLIGPALRELKSAIKLYREGSHTEDIGRALLSQIGELAQIAGWIASDAGRHEEAERIYKLGMSAAQQAGDATLVGNLAGSLAYQYSNTGQEQQGLLLARAALEQAGDDASPKARALYLDRVAWAHTKANEAQPAMRALGEASEALAEDSEGRESPQYLYWVEAGELQVMESRVYTELKRPLRAVPLLREVLARYDATHTRELALYLSWLAVALADANEPEEAAATAQRVITLSADVASERTAERVKVVLRRLEEYQDVPEVREILDEAA